MQHPVKLFYQSTLRDAFPPVRFAFAYGSAVFQQQGRDKGKMLDLVFVVDEPPAWHKANLAGNAHHYSFLRFFGPRTVSRLQRYTAGVYYNTLCHVGPQLLKYGVIATEDLISDLHTWKWLYVAGRLHKPVLLLTDPALSSETGDEPKALADAMALNWSSAALCGSLLTCKENPDIPFSKEALYMNIASLSYQGDFRMIIGEDKHKVRNLVRPYIKEFDDLYKPYLTEFVVEEEKTGRLRLRGDVILDKVSHRLPSAVAYEVACGRGLQDALSSIVFSSSWRQSAKGVLTAGLTKTVAYSAEKLVKMARSMLS